MEFIYFADLIPILISWIMFSFLATAHRVLLPNKYSAFLQFKEDENVNRTIQSASIRMLYLIIGTCFLNMFIGFNEKQIGMGIFIACFLNVWPIGFFEQLGENVIIRKKVFMKGHEVEIEFICDNEYYIGIARDFAREYGCTFEVDEY